MCLISPQRDEIIREIYNVSEQYKVSAHEMLRVLECESNLNPHAVGDGGLSRGIAQIHRPSHPHIPDEKVFDWRWSVRWMARQFNDGKQEMWTCWRSNFGKIASAE